METMVKAGRVPGMIVELTLNGSGPFSVFDVMVLAAEEIGRKRGLGRPAFTVSKADYSDASGRLSVDIPQLNGRMLATKAGERWENVAWDTTVSDGDIVLVVPKIQGNQFTVSIGRVPGVSDIVGIYAPGDPEGGTEAGSVAEALSAAGLELRPGEAVFVNGDLANLATALSEGDRVAIKAVPVSLPSEEEDSDEEYSSLPEGGIDDADLAWATDQASTLRQQGEGMVARAARAEAAIAAYQAAREHFQAVEEAFRAILAELE